MQLLVWNFSTVGLSVTVQVEGNGLGNGLKTVKCIIASTKKHHKLLLSSLKAKDFYFAQPSSTDTDIFSYNFALHRTQLSQKKNQQKPKLKPCIHYTLGEPVTLQTLNALFTALLKGFQVTDEHGLRALQNAECS